MNQCDECMQVYTIGEICRRKKEVDNKEDLMRNVYRSKTFTCDSVKDVKFKF